MEKIVFKKYNEKYRSELNTWVRKEQISGGNGFNSFVVVQGEGLGDYLSFIQDEMEDLECFVAQREKTLVGFFVINYKGNVVHIEICGINPDCRGQGLINKIISKLSKSLKIKGIEKITLSVNNKNTAGLKSFGKIGKKVEQLCKDDYTVLEIDN